MNKIVSPKIHQLQFLDGLRGIAALYVMIGHARWLLWEGYSEGYAKHPEQYGLMSKLLMYFLSLFKYGHEAVLFFFVLSGFVIHLKYANNLNNTQKADFKWTDYLYRRAKRIYPPFIFALLITFLLDTIGKQLHFSIYNGTTPYSLINDNFGHSSWDFKTLIGNLFFLYKNYIPVYGTNGPAWSLKFEWWFYMLYPLFLLAGTRKIIYPTLGIILLFVASFFPNAWPEKLLPDIFSMMITWWLGVLLAEIYTKRIRLNFKYLSFTALIILILPFIQMPNVFNDLCMAVFFFGLLSFFFCIPKSSLIIQFLQRLKLAGDFSYTLYIVHFPILVFMSGWVMHMNGNTLPSHFLYVFAGVIISVVFAYAVHFITEMPFVRSRKKPLITGEKDLSKAQNGYN